MQDALNEFDAVLLMVPLLVVATRQEVDEAKEVVAICKEYNIALRCELERRAVRSAAMSLWVCVAMGCWCLQAEPQCAPPQDNVQCAVRNHV